MAGQSHEASVSLVWKVCGLLAVVTIVEIGAALIHYYWFEESVPRILLNIFFIVVSAIKAYYIMSEFMHLKYELKALQLTVLLPFLFLVWGIIAFLWEGSYWHSLRVLWNV